MRVTCPGCRAVYELPAEAAERRPARLRCGACGTEWAPTPPSPHPAAPDPAAAAPAPSRNPQPGSGESREDPAGREAAEEDRAPRMAAAALREPAPEPAREPAHQAGAQASLHPDAEAGEDTMAIPAPPGRAAAKAAPESPKTAPAEAKSADPPPAPPKPAESPLPDSKSPKSKPPESKSPKSKPPESRSQESKPQESKPPPATSAARLGAEAGTPETALQKPDAQKPGAHEGTLAALQAGDAARAAGDDVAADLRRGSTRGWLVSVLLLILLIGLFLAFHGPIAHLWPASLRLYQAIGLA